MNPPTIAGYNATQVCSKFAIPFLSRSEQPNLEAWKETVNKILATKGNNSAIQPSSFKR